MEMGWGILVENPVSDKNLLMPPHTNRPDVCNLPFNNIIAMDDTQTPNKLYCCQLYIILCCLLLILNDSYRRLTSHSSSNTQSTKIIGSQTDMQIPHWQCHRANANGEEKYDLDLLTSGSVHAKVLPLTIGLPSLVLTAPAPFLLERGQTNRRN